MFYGFIHLAKGFRMRPKVWSTLSGLYLDYYGIMADKRISKITRRSCAIVSIGCEL